MIDRIFLLKKRHELNMTQDQLCEASGLSQSFVSQVECGRLELKKIETLVSWCNALGLNASEVVKW